MKKQKKSITSRNTNIFLTLAMTCAVLTCACANHSGQLNSTLQYAGKNRAELEAVLAHYKDEPLKYKAARYLIGNMKYHMSIPEGPYMKYCMTLDSLYKTGEHRDSIKAKIQEISDSAIVNLVPIPDIQNITAEYLIWNIDYSFSQLDSLDYLQHLDFNQFCEYILPYKCIEYQPLTRWKEQWRGRYVGDLYHIRQISDFRYNARRAAESLNTFLADSIKMVSAGDLNCIPVLDLPTLIHSPLGGCDERSAVGLLNCRSNAIPVSIDFTPNWPDRQNGHSWNNVLATKRRNIDYEPFKSFPGGYHYSDNGLAKVFRRTYAPHPLLLKAAEEGYSIPESLMPFFMKDVTDEYGPTEDIRIPLTADTKDRYVYLCVFDNFQWTPVDIGVRKYGKARFSKVGKGNAYLVMAMSDRDTLQPVSLPFILHTDGTVQHISPDKEHRCSIMLKRKFPAFAHIYSVNRFIRGGKIEAADNPEFRNPESIVTFPEWNLLAGEETVQDTAGYRYWRLMSSHSGSSDFAELYFYKRDSGKRVKGELIVPDIPIRNPYYDTPSHINDDNPLSYLAVQDTSRWIGFDFGRPVSMSKIAYIRRGDGNDICPGEKYELYCWDDNRWQLQEQATAENVYLVFNDVPSDGLYYIKCPTSGRQNRIFLYEDNEVIWY